MKVFVLIMTLVYQDSAAITTQEFTSYNKCDNAGYSWAIQNSHFPAKAKYICVEK